MYNTAKYQSEKSGSPSPRRKVVAKDKQSPQNESNDNNNEWDIKYENFNWGIKYI